MSEFHLTKSEAVRRQINAGIRILFDGEDPLAVITVASAAFGIVRGLAKRSKSNEMEQRFEDLIVPGKEKEFWDTVNAPANFLKHGSRDPQKTIKINEQLGEAVLLMCVLYYRELGHASTREMNTLANWYVVLNPKLMLPGNPLEKYTTLPIAEEFRKLPRAEQLKYGKMMLGK